MKVLVFTTLYPNHLSPNLGVFIKERMTSFARRGHEVRVVAPVPYYPAFPFGARAKYARIEAREEIEGVTVYHPRYFMTPKVGMSTYGMTMFRSVLPFLKRLRREFDFDLIDAHYVYPDGFAAVKLAQYCNKPVVVSARGSDIHLFSTFPLIRRLLRYTLARADHVIAVSQALQNAIIALPVDEKKTSVIPNGVDTQKFFRVDKKQSRERLGLPEAKIILSVGRLEPVKGFALLIKAFQKLFVDEEKKDARLVIVGEGSERAKLERLIATLHLHEHVRLMGARPHDELKQWYSAADCLCLASEREGWPNVVLEAFACGTPVVATEVWGMREVIPNEELGVLAPRDENHLTRALACALNKKWQNEVLVEHARERSWEKVAQQVEHTFERVLTSRKGVSGSPRHAHRGLVTNSFSAVIL